MIENNCRQFCKEYYFFNCRNKNCFNTAYINKQTTAAPVSIAFYTLLQNEQTVKECDARKAKQQYCSLAQKITAVYCYQ